MRRPRLTGLVLLALASSLLGAAPAAAAEFGPIRLISRTVPEQAKEAGASAISADGRYVAFEGTIEEGQKGVFRADLTTGELEPVATGSAYEPSSPGADAKAPSISADGRFVSFTTAAPLDPVDDTQAGSKDVYVADMSTSPPTYELASALDGSSTSMGGASEASPRVALSGDGRKVVFVNAGQVYLRDLDTRQTTLVSVSRNPATEEMEPGVPVPGGAVMERVGLPLLKGAAISADGTTVAWMGAHLPAQVPLLADEEQVILGDDSHGELPYGEPLWRRVAGGPQAPTRRIVGGGDPFAPGCPGTTGTLSEPDCQGPFPGISSRGDEINLANGWLGVPTVDGVPQLSADGRTVALIGNPTEATNVFLVDMEAGLSRDQAVRQLTAQVPVKVNGSEAKAINQVVALNGHIFDIAISADGTKIAFVSGRQRYPLAPPYLDTPPPSQLGLVELYEIDLEAESIQRLTHGFGGEGEASLGVGTELAQNGFGAASPSVDADGGALAFSSTAWNLVPGDGNGTGGVGASDVFAIEALPPIAAPQGTLSPPPTDLPKHHGRLALSAVSLPDGSVRLVALAPTPGTLLARASASLAVGSRPRRLAGGRAKANAGVPVKVTLSLPARYRRLARSREGLYATARVTFRAAAGRLQHRRLQIRFRTHRGHRRGA
jgi:Tol biopolymer transport system component